MALIATPHADVARMLSELGHQVLATADPAEATRADMAEGRRAACFYRDVSR